MTQEISKEFVRALGTIGIPADEIRFQDGAHPFTISLVIPRLPSSPASHGQPGQFNDAELHSGQLVLSSFVSDPASKAISVEGIKARILHFLKIIRPHLMSYLRHSDLHLTVNVQDGGLADLLSFERPAGTATPLFPDLYLLLAEAPAEDTAWEDFKAAFAAREPMLFWRGSTTGSHSASRRELSDNPRVRACRAIAKLPRGLADCKVTQIVQSRGFNLARAALELRIRGLMGDRVPETVFAQYRMTIDLPGNSAAWGACYKYLAGCLVLRPRQSHDLIYSDRLVAWEHYIPLREDLSDLEERLAWVAAHPDEAASIAWQGQTFFAEVVRELPRTIEGIFREQTRQAAAVEGAR